ncbi:Polyketide synthase, type III like protein, partial [Aduncisulcus paluster]
MGWTVDPEGFGVVFQRTIPDFVRDHVGPAVAEILARMQLTTDDIDRFLCHPGGAKVIAALERALALDQGTLDHERDVIAACGNMSAPTLRRAEARGVNLASVILALVTLQRFGELVLSRRNTERLLTRGAIEVGAAHYPLIVLLHA